MKADREPILTLANLLTLARLPLAALAWAAPGSRMWLISLVALAAITDVFDGRVARAAHTRRLVSGEDPGRVGQAQAIGAWLDPVCDKIFAVSIFGAVAVGFRPPLFVVLLVLTREMLVVFFYGVYRLAPWLQRRHPLDFRAGRAGKMTTVGQFVTAFAILFAPPLVVAAAAGTAVLGVVAAVDYARRSLADDSLPGGQSEPDQVEEATAPREARS